MNKRVAVLMTVLAMVMASFPEVPQVVATATDGNIWCLDESTIAKKEDYLSSPASSNYEANVQNLQKRVKQWREEYNGLWKNVNRHDEKEIARVRKDIFARKLGRLAELRASRLAGVYESKLYNILELPTKEAAARTVKRREMQDLARWQMAVNRVTRDMLSDLRSLYAYCVTGQDGLLMERACRDFGLSAYDRSMIENGNEWDQFSMETGNLPIQEVNPPHVPLYPSAKAQIGWDADAYVRCTEKYYEPASKDFAGAFAAYVEFSTNVDAFADAKIVDSFARNIATRLEPCQRVWLVRQLCLAHGTRHLAPWRLLVAVGTIQAKAMQESGAQGKCSDEIAWLRNAVGTQYFKGQISRLADDAFRFWLRSELDKLLGRRITEEDFKYVCKDEVLLMRNDYKVRKPRDGGDVLPHPFTLFGCTLGIAYDEVKSLSIRTCGEKVLGWSMHPRIAPYFGKENVCVWLAPRSKIAYSMEFEWRDVKTKKDGLAMVKELKMDLEKRLGVTLGGLFFEVDGHVCDESKWWSAPSAYVKSRSVFGPIMIEICAACKAMGTSYVKLEIIDKEAEAIVEKERKENPLKYDREAERRRFERLKDLSRRRKAMKDAQKAGGTVQ